MDFGEEIQVNCDLHPTGSKVNAINMITPGDVDLDQLALPFESIIYINMDHGYLFYTLVYNPVLLKNTVLLK